jgi:predicted kinase
MTPPFVVVALMGLPGSGKSTLAAELAARTGLAVLDRDAIRAAMFPPHIAGIDEKPAATSALWQALRAMLAGGHGAIIDGMTFASVRNRRIAAGMAEAFGARWLAVELRVSLRTAQQRVRAQAHSSKERTPKLVRQVAARFAPAEAGVLIVDGLLPVEAQLAEVLVALNA